MFSVEPEIRRNRWCAARRRPPGHLDLAASASRGDSVSRRPAADGVRLSTRSSTTSRQPGFRSWLRAPVARRSDVVGRGSRAFTASSGPRCCSRGAPTPARWGRTRTCSWSGTKMSKAAGTAVTLGRSDRAARRRCVCGYFLLREVGFDNDGDFTWERFDARYTADLAGTLATWSHAPRDIHRYRDGTGRAPGEASGRRSTRVCRMRSCVRRLYGCEPAGRRSRQLIAIAASANRYIEERRRGSREGSAARGARCRAREPWRARRYASPSWRIPHPGEGRGRLGLGMPGPTR